MSAHGDLEEDDSDLDAVTDHDPASAGRVLAVVHGIQELVFVDEASNQEVGEAGEDDFPAVSKDTVDDANYEDQNCLWQVKAVAESRRLDQFGIVYDKVSHKVSESKKVMITSRSLGTHQTDRIQCYSAKLEKPEWEQSKALQNNKVGVESEQLLQRLGKLPGEPSGVSQVFLNIFVLVVEIGSGS